MKLLKKLSLTALTLALSFSFVSCGNSDNGNSESNQGSSQTEASTNDNGKPTLTYLDVATPPKDVDKVNKKLNEYLDEKGADYNVNLVFWDWGDYEQKLQLASNTGEDWDICFTSNWSGPYRTMVEKGAFMDITDLLKDKGKNITEKVSDEMFKGVGVDGKIYGVPAGYPGVVSGNYFVWNKPLVDKYKIPVEEITDMSQLEPYLKKVQEGEANVEYPINVANDFLLSTPKPQFLVTPGVAVREENGKLVAYNSYADEAFKKEVFKVKDLMDKGFINPSAAQIDAGNGETGDKWLVTKAEGEPGSDAVWQSVFKTEVVSYPFGEFNQISNDKAQGKMAAINSQSKNADYAMDFLNRMFEDNDLMNILCYGIEGEHYEVKDGKIDKSIDENKNYDVPAFTFLSNYTTTPLVGGAAVGEEDYDKQVEIFKSKLESSPVLGFNLDRKPIETELTNIEQTISEYEKNIKTGTVDEAYYDEFLEKLNTAGIDKAVEEIQKQVDAWQK